MGALPAAVALLAHATSVVAPAAAWAVASVFIWSGVAKARRPEQAALALVDFGILKRPRIRAGAVLGALEIALALSVIAIHPIGALVAVGVCLAFAVVLLRSLVAGKRFPCYCFGGSEEISALSLFRALALLALAIVVSAEPPTRTLDGQLAGAVAGVASVSLIAVASSTIALSRVPRQLRQA